MGSMEFRDKAALSTLFVDVEVQEVYHTIPLQCASYSRHLPEAIIGIRFAFFWQLQADSVGTWLNVKYIEIIADGEGLTEVTEDLFYSSLFKIKKTV